MMAFHNYPTKFMINLSRKQLLCDPELMASSAVDMTLMQRKQIAKWSLKKV